VASAFGRKEVQVQQLILIVALMLAGGMSDVRPAPDRISPESVVRVLMVTEVGDIEIEVDIARAPISGANFLKYVDARKYDGGSFHRTVRPDNQKDHPVPIGVVQAQSAADEPGDLFPAVPLERTRDTRLLHKDGTVSLARAGVDTATDHFFICIGDQPALDYGGARNPDGQGFAAFGRVVSGMHVVRKIQAAPARGERLTPPIGIISVRRVP
jgi:peptidyl-prolyl cis-trans isomerase A (cyclophilin A)